MDAITLRNVTKRFKKRTIRDHHTTLKSELIRWLKGQKRPEPPAQHIEALRGVDLSVPKGKTMGIIGRNGSGKSTLLKLITGIYTPTTGTVEVNGRISALLELGAGFHPDFSGRENILINGIILGMSRSEVKARMDEIIAFSELGDFIDEPVRTYSSGMYMRLAFSVATHVNPDILLIDEILAVGDAHFSKKSLGKMNEFKRSNKTIVLVTHDLDAVQRWCDVAVWIDGGRVRLLGEPAQVVEQYRQAVAEAEAQSSEALAQPGMALPSPAPPPFELRFIDARLLGADGQARSTFDVEEPVELLVELELPRPVPDPSFAVALLADDGRCLYATSTDADGAKVPSPFEGRMEVRLSFARLGLLAGHYRLELSARSGETNLSKKELTFTVISSAKDFGLFRPVHRWTVEAGSAGRTATAP